MHIQGYQPYLNHLKTIYQPHTRTLLACSGGPDSLALFYLFILLSMEWGNFYFEIFHLNHLTLGNYAYDSGEYVEQISQRYHIPYHHYIMDIPFITKKQKGSTEEVGRYYRYEFMNHILKLNHLDSISIAHHQDDQIETILMRLFEGGGINATAGMQTKVQNKIRPLLAFSKKELIQFLNHNQLHFYHDPSNSMNHYKRNKVRNQIIPVIEKTFPHMRSKIIQFSNLLQNYQKAFQHHLPSLTIAFPGEKKFTFSLWQSISLSLRGDFLYQEIQTLIPHLFLSYRVIQILVHQINQQEKKSKWIYKKKHLCIYQSHQTIYLVNDFIFNHSASKDYFKILFLKEYCGLTILPVTKKDILFFEPKRTIKKWMSNHRIPLHHQPYLLGLSNQDQCIGVINSITQECFLHRKYAQLESKIKERIKFN